MSAQIVPAAVARQISRYLSGVSCHRTMLVARKVHVLIHALKDRFPPCESNRHVTKHVRTHFILAGWKARQVRMTWAALVHLIGIDRTRFRGRAEHRRGWWPGLPTRPRHPVSGDRG